MSYSAMIGGKPLLYLSGSERIPVPRITSPFAVNAEIGEPFVYQITTTIPTGGGPVTSYGALNLPAWATLNPATGEITGTPVVPLGLFNVTLQATNAEGIGQRALRITVIPRPVIQWASYWGPAPSLIAVGGANIDHAFMQTLPNTRAVPAVGDVMIAPAPVGSFGPVFAYPATLPPASGIQDSVAGPVLGSFTHLTVTVTPPHPADPPQNYHVYFIRFAGAATVVGTTSTMTI
jgi:hypothetical protein